MSKGYVVLKKIDGEVFEQSFIDAPDTPNGIVSTPQPSSVEIAKDAKGNPKQTVKVYHVCADTAADQAIALYFHVQEQINKRLEAQLHNEIIGAGLKK